MGTRGATVLRRLAWALMALGGVGVNVIWWYDALWNGERHATGFAKVASLASIVVGLALFVYATRKPTARVAEPPVPS